MHVKASTSRRRSLLGADETNMSARQRARFAKEREAYARQNASVGNAWIKPEHAFGVQRDGKTVATFATREAAEHHADRCLGFHPDRPRMTVVEF